MGTLLGARRSRREVQEGIGCAVLMVMHGGSVVALLLVCLVEWGAGLRTGVAPTYIPTMRQITSFETNNIDTMNDAVVHMRTLELEQAMSSGMMHNMNAHWQLEFLHNNQLKNKTAALRAQLTTMKNNKVYNDDQSYREFDRNKGLEPENVALTVTKTTQDNYIWMTNTTNRILDAHSLATLALNNGLLAEKQALWLSIEANEREEWFNHENAIAVEVQNPLEAKSKEYHIEQHALLDQFVTDLTTRNTLLAAQVPALTSDRDAQEAAKLVNIVNKSDLELQADNLELEVPTLMKSKAALEKLKMQFQMANADLLNYNTKLKEQIDVLTTERDALRKSFEDAENARNAAQIEADHFEVLFTDMKGKVIEAKHARSIQHVGNDFARAQDTVCRTLNTQLKSEKAALQTMNANIRLNCY